MTYRNKTKTAKKKRTKKPAPKIPFSMKAKKGYTTLHLLVGVSADGSVIAHQTVDDETMVSALSAVHECFDFAEHVDVHHLVAILPVAKIPKPKIVRPKKIATLEPRQDAVATDEEI